MRNLRKIDFKKIDKYAGREIWRKTDRMKDMSREKEKDEEEKGERGE